MVLEQLFTARWLERRHYYAFILGFVYAFIGVVMSRAFFGVEIGIPMVFLTSLLLIPSLVKLLDLEEKKEAKEGLKHFFRNHKEIFVIYLFLFLGLLVFYLGFGSLASQGTFVQAFRYQLSEVGLFETSIQQGSIILSGTALNLAVILKHNFMIVIFSFILSFFYGAGAIFLIVYNASVFASAISAAARFSAAMGGRLSNLLYITGLLSIHLIPEVAAYLIAAIAGGIISKAVIKEKIGSTRFKRVITDSMILFGLAIVLVIVAAYLEVFVTPAFIV